MWAVPAPFMPSTRPAPAIRVDRELTRRARVFTLLPGSGISRLDLAQGSNSTAFKKASALLLSPWLSKLESALERLCNALGVSSRNQRQHR